MTSKPFFSALAAVILTAGSLNAQTTKWTVDAVHSNIKFTVTHMVVSEVEGSFKKFDGTVENGKPDFSDAVVNFTVDVNSVNTDNEMRDGHLKSDDFFNAAKYPAMTFKSSSVKVLGGNKYQMTGTSRSVM